MHFTHVFVPSDLPQVCEYILLSNYNVSIESILFNGDKQVGGGGFQKGLAVRIQRRKVVSILICMISAIGNS
ncbi:hypothetical protein LENED_005423 [Lentinula edodes]|uniref:Uncharacterized protein n=1 Tax=Lentinula edodes TaxID=5353 RepID=A0A1Q3E8W9_LENED|nr:hypothetical protein LENED_005423 [Lentinula edodes]